MRKLALAHLLAALTLAVAASPVGADGGPSNDAAAADASFSLVNQERSARGKPSLAWDGDLARVAREHSMEMAEDDDLHHNQNLPNEIEGGWDALGENVGYGPDAAEVHDAFMDSDTHRHNILDAYTHVGVGAIRDGDTLWVTQVFVTRDSGGSGGGSGGSGATRPRITRTKPPVRTVVSSSRVRTAASAVQAVAPRAPRTRVRAPGSEILSFAMLDRLATEWLVAPPSEPVLGDVKLWPAV